MFFKISWRSLIKMFLMKNPKILNSECFGKLCLPEDLFLFYMCVSQCVYMYHMHSVLGEARRGQQLPLELELLAIGNSLQLVTEPRSSAWVAVSALNHEPSLQPHKRWFLSASMVRCIQMCPYKTLQCAELSFKLPELFWLLRRIFNIATCFSK